MDDVNEYFYTFSAGSQARVRLNRVKRSQVKSKLTYNGAGYPSVKPITWTKARVHASPRRNVKNGSLLEVWTEPEPWSSSFYPYCPAALSSSVREQAAVKWYARVSNTNALLPLMYKERQKTVDLVAKKIVYLAKLRKNFLKKIKHLLLTKSDKKARHELLESKWLEYRYGWLPTLMDMDKLINTPLGLPSARVAAKADSTFDYKSGDGRSTPRMQASGRYYEVYGAYITPKNPLMKTGAQYGITNPGLVLWEMVPFSFVIDWVFDVGGYLESLGALSGLTIVDQWRTYGGYLQKVSAFDAAIVGNSGWTSGYCNSMQTNGTRVKEVAVYPNPLVPSNGLNLTRLFDAIALCDTIFGTKKRKT